MKHWILAVWILGLLGMVVPAHAAIQEIRVLAAGIDGSSRKAEEIAMDYAKKRAVYLAARKLGVPNPGAAVARFTDDQYRAIIRGMDVVNNRREGYTTYSDVNVTIVDEALRRALGLPIKPVVTQQEVKVRGILLLPVYVGQERAYVWEKENLLKESLANEVRRQSRAGVLLPGGDFDDLRLIDHLNALTIKPDELKPMFERYGAEEIVIAVLTPSAAGTMDVSSVLLRRLRADSEHNEVLEISPESEAETSTARLDKAATAIAAAVTQIASSTSDQEQVQRATAKQLKAQFQYSVPKELAKMTAAVRAAPEVLSLDMPSIALARVDGTIYLRGDSETLRDGLVKQGIVVTEMEDGWRLSTR